MKVLLHEATLCYYANTNFLTICTSITSFISKIPRIVYYLSSNVIFYVVLLFGIREVVYAIKLFKAVIVCKFAFEYK